LGLLLTAPVAVDDAGSSRSALPSPEAVGRVDDVVAVGSAAPSVVGEVCDGSGLVVADG